MIWADRLGLVWGALIALLVFVTFRKDFGHIDMGEVFLVWLIFTSVPWLFLRGLRWVVVGGNLSR